MRVLVTGGAGFIGSHIADALLQAGHEVAIVDDLSSGNRANVPAQARFYEVDLVDADALDRVFAEFRPQAVSHQGAQTSVAVSTREPTRDASTNVVGTIQVLRCCVTHGVVRLVFASTGGAIYGEVPEPTRAKVGDPTFPLSPYACSKLAAEYYLAAWQAEYGLSTTVLRYANVYGPRQDPHGEAGVVAIFARRLLAGQPLQINAMSDRGDDGCVRDYVAVTDVVRANLRAITGELSMPTLNVCTGTPTTTLQIAKGLMAALDTEVELTYGPRRAGDLRRSVLDPAAMIEVLGPPTPLEEGLAQTAAWFRGQAI